MDGKGCCAVPASCGTEKKEDKKGGCGACGCNPCACACGPKKGCCGLVLKGALLGGIAMFLWLTFSWMALPWHMATMQQFKNEKAVAKVLLDNAPKSGIYLMPWRENAETKPAVDKPFTFVSVLTEGYDCLAGMNKQMGCGFLLSFAMAGLLTCLMKKQASGCPVGFSMAVGVLLALGGYMPGYIWWKFPLDWTLVGMADTVISTTFAGLVIAKFVLKKKIGCGTPSGSCG